MLLLPFLSAKLPLPRSHAITEVACKTGSGQVCGACFAEDENTQRMARRRLCTSTPNWTINGDDSLHAVRSGLRSVKSMTRGFVQTLQNIGGDTRSVGALGTMSGGSELSDPATTTHTTDISVGI